MTANPDAIIVGAGPAGLACAVTMRAAGLNVTVLERADSVGSVWRRHYDRLHLHTDRKHSGLPGMVMAKTYPLYPAREQVVEYLENYAARFDIQPVFNTTVSRIRPDGTQWRAELAQGSISAPVVVVATGMADAPYRPSWPGSEVYRGPVVHSCEYRNPTRYAGKRVLVVGFGNSGGEIALDLANAGIDVTLRFEAPFRFCPAISWAFRSWHGQSCIGGYPRAPGRFDQRSDIAVGYRSNRKAGIALRVQRTASNGRGGWTRAADRHRHAG